MTILALVELSVVSNLNNDVDSSKQETIVSVLRCCIFSIHCIIMALSMIMSFFSSSSDEVQQHSIANDNIGLINHRHHRSHHQSIPYNQIHIELDKMRMQLELDNQARLKEQEQLLQKHTMMMMSSLKQHQQQQEHEQERRRNDEEQKRINNITPQNTIFTPPHVYSHGNRTAVPTFAFHPPFSSSPVLPKQNFNSVGMNHGNDSSNSSSSSSTAAVDWVSETRQRLQFSHDKRNICDFASTSLPSRRLVEETDVYETASEGGTNERYQTRSPYPSPALLLVQQDDEEEEVECEETQKSTKRIKKTNIHNNHVVNEERNDKKRKIVDDDDSSYDDEDDDDEMMGVFGEQNEFKKQKNA